MISKNQFRNFILFVGVIIVFSFNSSCKRNNTSIDTSEDTLTFLYIGDERIFHQDYWGMEATYWIFLPLVTNVGDERGETAPVLAESWSHSKDYRNWTVHLRKDIFWLL